MDVSPASAGNVKVNGEVYTGSCGYNDGTVLNIEAVEDNNSYRFDHWGGGLSGSANPTTLTMNSNKSVTAYFKLKTEAVNLQQAKDLIDGGKDLLVIDVSSASNYDNSHMLCAKNYAWNSGSNSFSTSITNLTPYKDDDILIYDQNGALSQNAADYLASQGFGSIYYMTDGLDDWIAEGYETFTTAEDADVCTSLTPMAYAGPNQEVDEKTQVTLRGQGPDGASFAWSQIEGENVTLSPSNQAQTSFTAPDLTDGNDTLIFQLTVTDNQGKKDSDRVAVHVKWNNASPTANAGPNQTVTAGTLVTLDGSGSSDPENSIVSYQWSLTSGTITPSLSSPSSVSPSFTPASAGWVIYQLTVTDNGGLTDTDTVKITVESGSSNTNEPPVANAGDDQTVNEGDTVTLSGSATDSDGSIESYAWSQTGTPAVTLSDPAAQNPTFTAPDVSSSTVLTFTLTVTDDDDAIDTDTVKVTVNDNDTTQNVAPTADAGKDQSVNEGETVVLDGSGSSDSDGTIDSYAWTQTGGTPAVTLSNPAAQKPTFSAPDVDKTTTLTFSLVVTDDKGKASTPDTVAITITTSSGGGGGGGGCFIHSLAGN